MTGPTIVDAGPLVALIDRRDFRHDWAEERFDEVATPLLTCESVLSEACFLLRHVHGGWKSLMGLVAQGVLKLDFRLDVELAPVSALMARSANVPMSLADACLVRMAEIHPNGRVLTLDGDFRVYRKNGREAIDVVAPDP